MSFCWSSFPSIEMWSTKVGLVMSPSRLGGWTLCPVWDSPGLVLVLVLVTVRVLWGEERDWQDWAVCGGLRALSLSTGGQSQARGTTPTRGEVGGITVLGWPFEDCVIISHYAVHSILLWPQCQLKIQHLRLGFRPTVLVRGQSQCTDKPQSKVVKTESDNSEQLFIPNSGNVLGMTGQCFFLFNERLYGLYLVDRLLWRKVP